MDEPVWDPGVIIDYWLDQPDNHELPTRELALKPWSHWSITTFPHPSDEAKLVRSTLARHSGTGALKFQYFGDRQSSQSILLSCPSILMFRKSRGDRGVPFSHLRPCIQAWRPSMVLPHQR